MAAAAAALALAAAPPAAANPIEAENARAAPQWRPSDNVSRSLLDGYVARSVKPGDQLDIRVSAAAGVRYRIEIRRLGWYAGSGSRRVACLPGPTCSADRTGIKQPSPPPPDATTGRVAAGWSITDPMTVPSDWPSGFYVAEVKITSGESADLLSLPFVVRAAPGTEAPIAVLVPTNTWEAYNNWGGKSLYTYNSTGGVKATHLSFDRPFRSQPMFGDEFPLMRYLERNGFNLDYVADVDLDRAPASLAARQLVIVAGHGEYWTKAMRDGFEAARDAGTNLAFIGANIAYWQVRYEDSRGTLVGYKSAADPNNDPAIETIRWRDLATPRPECKLLGVQYMGGIDDTDAGRPYTVTAPAGDPWLAGTGLAPGAVVSNLVGYEWDRIVDGCMDRPLTSLLHYTGSPTNADAVRYTAASGARVFSAGSLHYPRGLDDRSAWWGLPNDSSPGIQRMTTNALDDLGVGRTVPDSVPPEAFAPLEPADGLVGQTGPSTFRWERAFDSTSRVVRYELRVDGAAVATLRSEECGQQSCSWTAPSGWPEGSHTWTVAAVDAAGRSRATPARTFVVDATRPVTTITSGPSGLTRSASPSFGFSSEAGASFKCRLDAGAWADCASPKSYGGLSEGAHVFAVRATDRAGNVELVEASRSFTVDTVAPDTTIATGPSGLTNSAAASFTFSSEAGASFECRLDAGAWAGCTSPKGYGGLSEGAHVFAVRAADAAGNVDPSEATRSFTVDTVAPETTIATGPSGLTSSGAASFTFSSEPGASFKCRLDGGAWADCTSPKSYSGLSDGTHVFAVRATDAAGNVDPSEATRSFTVDTTPPQTSILTGTPGPTTVRSAFFTFVSTELGATFECALGDATWSACASPWTYTGLGVGEHVFRVRARDAVGNVEASPASWTWTVLQAGDPPPPGDDEDPPPPAGTDSPIPPAAPPGANPGPPEVPAPPLPPADPIEVPAGTTLSTAPGLEPSPQQPLIASVTTPVGGRLAIELREPPGSPAAGFVSLGRELAITAPDASAEQPLRLTFLVDASLLPISLSPDRIAIFRDGVALPPCETSDGSATPDPCVASRRLLPSGAAELVALSSRASVWSIARQLPFADTRPPRLGALRIAPRTFTAGERAEVSYRVSEAASVTFTVSRSRAGRVAGRLERMGDRGSFELTARWRGGRLRPGRYRLTAVAVDAAGNRGPARSAPFRILRRGSR